MSANTKRWLIDTAERTARTFVQGFLGVVTLDALADGFNPSLLEKFELGLLAGGYAVLVAFVGKTRGAPDSASLLSRPHDPPRAPVTEEPRK